LIAVCDVDEPVRFRRSVSNALPSSLLAAAKHSALVLAVTTAIAAGCGEPNERSAKGEPPATLSASALPALSNVARTLDTTSLAADSFHPAAVRKLLVNDGYLTGREREFFGHGPRFNHVVARALRFKSSDGAANYLAWVAAHAADFLGNARRESTLGLGDAGSLFSLVGCQVCRKEQPALLAAWRRGDTVAFLLGQGPGVNRESFAALARKLDERIA
jgi:hypothetical protein